MHKTIILMSAAIGIMTASSAFAKAQHSGFRGTIEAGFAAQDKKMCRWDAPPGGGPACRLTKMSGTHYTHATTAGKMNGSLGEEKVRFEGVYYNGQQWADTVDAFMIFEKTRSGWQFKYSSIGNGESGLAAGAPKP
jgi:hypothetical protein